MPVERRFYFQTDRNGMVDCQGVQPSGSAPTRSFSKPGSVQRPSSAMPVLQRPAPVQGVQAADTDGSQRTVFTPGPPGGHARRPMSADHLRNRPTSANPNPQRRIEIAVPKSTQLMYFSVLITEEEAKGPPFDYTRDLRHCAYRDFAFQ
eukprot:CAMPEP_0113702886 /NCGR_PEP_ID=MMETSP0038_2-20120614/25495_1 /TAXON_ID=2898 /ORGANISM="Cryptomonas paramecium" /LENGTH=148 /DNA_ID=CAMNT_0000627171 /DNA_START=1 /DNA_END=444 /DNA_ORIENTATION=+ /assembly_acc=CAM_ASM_000170